MKIAQTLSDSFKLAQFAKSDRAEIKELCDTIKKHGFDGITIKAVDKNNARITARKANSDISFDLDFANRTETQTMRSQSITLSLINPVKEWIQTVKGSLSKAKIVRTVNKECRKDGKLGKETIDYQNLVNGTHFRMVRIGDNKPKFYRNIDGDFVEMFTK